MHSRISLSQRMPCSYRRIAANFRSGEICRLPMWMSNEQRHDSNNENFTKSFFSAMLSFVFIHVCVIIYANSCNT